MSQSKNYYLIAATLTLALWAGGVGCVSAATLSAAQLSTMLKDPNLKLSASSTTVVGTGPAITVLAEEDPKITEQELKIDAIFVSKALIEAAPGQIESVKVLFSQSGRNGRFITISNKEIQDFGKGKITPDKLLATLQITDVEPDRAPDVQPGAAFEKRLLVWRRIEKLRQQGTGVRPFENIFHEIEASVKAGDSSKVEEKVAFIESKLSDQEEQLKQAKKTAHGHGVPAASISQQMAASGGPATDNKGGQPTFIPPEAEHLRRSYEEKAVDVIQQVDRKNKAHGDQLRSLKQHIDVKFTSHLDAEAYALMKQFSNVVQTDLGADPFGPPDGGMNNRNANAGNQTGRQGGNLWGQQQGGNTGPNVGGPGQRGFPEGGPGPGPNGPGGPGPGPGF